MIKSLLSPEDLLKEARELVADKSSLCEVLNIHAGVGDDEICQWLWKGVQGGDVIIVISGNRDTLTVSKDGKRRVKPRIVTVIHRVPRSRHASVQQLLYFKFDRPYWEIGCDRERAHLQILIDRLRPERAYHIVAG